MTAASRPSSRQQPRQPRQPRTSPKATPAKAGEGRGAFVALLLSLVAAEALDLGTTLRLAVASGQGYHAEWNPAAALAWARYGPLGLVAFKLVMTLWVLLAATLLRRLGAPRLASAGAVAAMLAYDALALLHVWQFAHLPGFYLG